MIRMLASVAVTWVALVIGVSAQQGLSAKAQENHSVLAQELRRGLERKLQTVVEGLDGVIGYAALDLNSGEEIGHLEQEEFPTASTIKLAILYELCQQAEAGRINLETSAPLDRHTVVGGSGILHALGTPTLSLRDHAVLMMTLSDNTAANVLIDAVGMSNVMSRMQSLGLTGIRLRRKMMDTAAAARGDENVATPRDIVRLLRVLHAGEGSNSEGKSAALKILELGAGGQIRLGVPEDVPILNKPGDLEGVRVDAAIVRAKNRPYALAVMTTYLKDENEGERAITETSRAFYEYFSRLGMGSEYGRQMKR
jgi:beta-lactamase class A